MKYDGNRSKSSMRNIDLKRSTPMPEKLLGASLNQTCLSYKIHSFLTPKTTFLSVLSRNPGDVAYRRVKFLESDKKYKNVFKNSHEKLNDNRGLLIQCAFVFTENRFTEEIKFDLSRLLKNN